MTAIALFQFHEQFELCRPRIALLHRLNPGLKIFGLYGGDPANIGAARSLETSGIEHVYHDASKPPAWNKKNTDLAVAAWFQAVGQSIPFDRAHVIQWDLLYFVPLHQAYARIAGDDGVGLTGLVPLAEIAHIWNWTVHEPFSSESQQFLTLAKEQLGYRGSPYACVGPGYSLPRKFLELYSHSGAGDIGHDELRLPLFAQLFGFRLIDTRFYTGWTEPEGESLFNADAQEIDVHRIKSELAKPNGRRVFHPCRESFNGPLIEQLLSLVTLAGPDLS